MSYEITHHGHIRSLQFLLYQTENYSKKYITLTYRIGLNNNVEDTQKKEHSYFENIFSFNMEILK